MSHKQGVEWFVQKFEQHIFEMIKFFFFLEAKREFIHHSKIWHPSTRLQGLEGGIPQAIQVHHLND